MQKFKDSIVIKEEIIEAKTKKIVPETTEYIGNPKKGRDLGFCCTQENTRRTLMLQDHDKNGSVSYRNIWMRKL